MKIKYPKLPYKKIVKPTLFLVAFLAFGVAGSVFADIFIFPSLSAHPLFSKYRVLKRSTENVTVINKTEQVTVGEDESINKIASQATATVVNILSIPDDGSPRANLASSGTPRNGSGLIVTSDGLVMTYRSAILEKGSSYKVFLNDGSATDASLLGIDEYSNVAYLKMDASNFPVAQFADSEALRSGRKLIAIGNGSGEYQNRFAAGLLSNVNKTFNIMGQSVASSEKMEGVFEVDFDNQYEYIGGPVIDYNAQVVGIVGSVIIDNQERYFIVPAESLKKSLDWAIDFGLENRPKAGISYLSITKSAAITHGLAVDRGALVYSPSGRQSLAVLSGSPAEKSGIRINDIIVAVDGREVNLDQPLSSLLNDFSRGETIELSVLREGEKINIEIGL